MDLGFGPDERPGGLIVVGDERVDVGDEFGNAGKGGAGERFANEDREPDFDLAEPGGVGWRVMEMHGLVALEPDVALGLVGGEIVEDDMDFALRIGGVAGINIKTSPDNFRPIRQLQLRRFNGEAWERLGDVLSD